MKKGNLFVSIIIIFVVSLLIPNFINNIRSKLETAFGQPNSFFSGVGIGVKKEKLGYYDMEYGIDEVDDVKIHLPNENVNLNLYGNVINSSEPLEVILNGKRIYKEKLESKRVVPFWKDIYLEKNFVVNLEGIVSNKGNEIMIKSGSAAKRVIVKVE
ncbi:hypothetical protein [Neobacillus niacini]|uniref:hypothetical protein n=1 Tax=Neobacillus niacini TaxID=86668 RepID=UPI0021CB9426|nr:hypothetical protein [Neobacillus niacini]MCM3767244.1 hypothetical protein [Neobacillus niacini]